jgi:deoxyribonuclease-4
VEKNHHSQPLLIGAHTSAAGGLHNALIEGKKIGATTIQLFTSNQRRWDSKPLTEEAIDIWKQTVEETGIKKIMSHDSYLINMGSPNPEILAKSQSAFKEELERCLQLEIDFLNFHPGAATDGDVDGCLDRIVESLLQLESLTDRGPTKLLLETTAGQGSSVGYRFEQIAYIVDRVKKRVPIGVCIDTCHIFAAGYDIRTKEGWESTLDEFKRHIEIKYLQAFHVNDSIKALGSRVDRHKDIGEGMIGIESFKVLMNHPDTKYLPKYLETPNGPPVWVKEIAMLREFAKS